WYRVRATDTSGNEGDWAAQTSAQLSQIAADHLAAGCITTAKIFAGAVTAEKITVAQLSAITADLGTITAGIVTGATIRTAAAGTRVVLVSTDGLQCYNGDGTLCAQLDVDGSGQIGASDLEVPPLTWNNLGQFNRIQANQLEMGSMFFNRADGMLLLNDYCYVDATSWRTLQKQVATISGAFHQSQGRWLGTRALMVEEATTNYCTNPSLETNTTDWAANAVAIARTTDEAVFGSYSLEVTPTANVWAYAYYGFTLVNGETYIASAYVKGEPGVAYNIGIYDWVEAAWVGGDVTQFTGTGQWQRVESPSGVAAGNNAARLRVGKHNDASEAVYYVDGAQIEQRSYATTYCDGAQGSGYSWAGAAHGSTSSRTATEVNLDAQASLVSGNDTWSVRIVAQAPYDDDDDWSGTAALVFTIRGANNAHYVYIDYDTASDEFELYVNGTVEVSGGYAFSAGDWLDIVATLDFTNDEYVLYVNAELIGTSTTSLSAAVVTQMNIGTWVESSNHWDGAIAEFALFDCTLAAASVAQMYNLQRPLVDGGGLETPGIYIVDGRFRIASSLTGNRIEIDADEIAGYDSGGTKQFYLQASDGKAVAGAGDVWMDEDGLALATGSGSSNQVKWLDGNDDIGRIYAYKSATTAILTLFAIGMDTGDDAVISLNAQDDIIGTTQLQIISPNVAGYDAAGTIIASV
ncbi:MAG TPA: LamG-like jellyroll fold domain-containing protein, partial [Planctomycetota bacterium]|nr:LamG-like jellyroll fold domain-containing protein [Planctomycetota bacterium]